MTRGQCLRLFSRFSSLGWRLQCQESHEAQRLQIVSAVLSVLLVFLAQGFAQTSGPAEQVAAEAALKTIRPEAIRAHMRFLSDSLLEGRDPGTPGYEIAARYVASELEGIGLKPGGANGTWYQPVSFRKAVVDVEQSTMVLVQNGKEEKLKNGVDYVLEGDVLRGDVSVDAPLVFAGFGVTAPELNYDDYSGIDARGKIVVVLGNAPARFPSTERAYYSDSFVKQKNAVAHGAVGVFNILTPEDQKEEPWEWLAPQYQVGDTSWLEENNTPHNVFAGLRVRAPFSPQGAAKLFAGAPQTLDQVFKKAEASQPQGFDLPAKAQVRVVSRQHDFRSPNIAGLLPGSDASLRNQYVVYSAHLDHLGICPPADGDKVCHGAYDNGSGVATVLELARAFAGLPRAPRRSILFLFVTGEEAGLLGSDYFATYPTVPKSAIVANVNIDEAPGLLYPLKDVVALGVEHSSLDRDVKRAAQQIGYQVSPDPMPEEDLFIRSDQYSFVLQGIPAVNPTDGMQSTDPAVNGLEVSKKWMTSIYHTPRDNMSQAFDYDSAARAAGFTLLLGYQIAQDDDRPTWNRNDFFGDKFGVGQRQTASTDAK